jgi:hypothetical protein
MAAGTTKHPVWIYPDAGQAIRTTAVLDRDATLPASATEMPSKISGKLPVLSEGDKVFIRLSANFEMLFNQTQVLYTALIDPSNWTFTVARKDRQVPFYKSR